MPITDYFPRTDADVSTFAIDFPAKLDLYKTPLGVTPAEIGVIEGNGDNMRQAIKDSNLARDAAKNATSAKDAELITYAEFISAKVREIKANPACTNAMLVGMGIVGTEAPFDPNTYQSTVSAAVYPGHVTIKFSKKGVDGVNVYSRLKGTPGWSKLSFDSHSPYVDNRPLTVPNVPEVREYMCMGVSHDQEIGQNSNVAVANFAG